MSGRAEPTGGGPDEVRFEALYQQTRVDLLAYLVRRALSAEDAADAIR